MTRASCKRVASAAPFIPSLPASPFLSHDPKQERLRGPIGAALHPAIAFRCQFSSSFLLPAHAGPFTC
jgi:hypothetical protein